VIFVIADFKRQAVEPLMDAISNSAELTSRWINAFELWHKSGAAASADAGGGGPGASTSAAGASSSTEALAGCWEPFTFPVLHLMVTADKVFSAASGDAILGLKACVRRHGADHNMAGLRAAQDRVLEKLRRSADASSLLEDMENAVRLGGRDGGLSREGAREIVRRQVIMTLNWQELWQVMEDPAQRLDAGQVRVPARAGCVAWLHSSTGSARERHYPAEHWLLWKWSCWVLLTVCNSQSRGWVLRSANTRND
jgi:hypothetical protein